MSDSSTDIQFTDDAIEDLRRLGPDAVPRVLKMILILETDPEAGYPLGGELTGFRKLVGRNTWRIVYRVVSGAVVVCEIWAVGLRRDAAVYAEASSRVAAAVQNEPRLAPLSELVERLGRLTSGLELPTATPREPVPDWLAQRLVHTIGMRPEVVAALDAEQAFERWNAYLTTPQNGS